MELSGIFDKSVDHEQFDRDFRIRTDGQWHRGTVNIDDMDPSDLFVAIHHPSLHTEVRRYAEMALERSKLRLAGNIAAALRLEQKMERVYKTQIPASLRW